MQSNRSSSFQEMYYIEEPSRLSNTIFYEPMSCHFLIKNNDHLFFIWSYSNKILESVNVLQQVKQLSFMPQAEIRWRVHQLLLKKVVSPKIYCFNLFERWYHFLICTYFAMFIIFHNLEVLQDGNLEQNLQLVWQWNQKSIKLVVF